MRKRGIAMMKNSKLKRWLPMLAGSMLLVLLAHAAAYAQGPAAPAAPEAPADVAKSLQTLTNNASSLRIGIDTVWVLIAGMLVFWMNAGFAMVESGLCRAKNCANILAKNFVVFAASTLSFWVLGWGLMFGDGSSPEIGKYIGTEGLWFVSGADNSPALG